MKKLMALAGLAILTGAFVLGCDAGSPPATPELFGPDTVGAGDTVTIRIWSSDRDDDYISFTIRWADGSADEETPFTAMLDTLTRTHVFDSTGTFGVTARAKDLNGKQSGWSDTLRITVTP